LNLFDDEPQRFGESLGGTLWGGTLYELAPGESVCPYHWHYGEEEWVLVVSGTATMRTVEGERVLSSWDVAAFPAGERGAHQLRNDGADRARLVMFSTASDPEVCVYPDTNEVGVVAGWSRTEGPQVRLTTELP
jgi:uncharacterized cupin superfamily protein